MSAQTPKRSLIARITDPASELRATRVPANRLSKTLFLWSKGAHAGQLALHADGLADHATPEERLQLAAILVEAGRLTQAADLAARTYAEAPELLAGQRYPALTLALSRLHPQTVAGLEAEVDVLARFARQGDLFRQMIETHRGAIAVVGNSPELLDSDRGAEIDEHAVVIRFNNFQLPPETRAATGVRTTVWARTSNYDWLWRRDRLAVDLALLPGQAPFYRLENAQDLLIDHDLHGRACAFIPHTLYHDLRLEHGVAAPSMGLLCLSWIHDILGSLDDVGLYGFRMTDQPRGDTVHYFKQGHPTTKHPHDWQSEYRVLHALAPDRFAPPEDTPDPQDTPEAGASEGAG